MTYLVDSDWLADFLKGRALAVRLLSDLMPDGLAISLVTYAEMYEGIYHGRDAASHERGFLAFLRSVTILPLNRSLLKRFARLRGDLRHQGQLIGDFDLLIAATALQHDLTLITRNVRHFQRIPGLNIYQPPS